MLKLLYSYLYNFEMKLPIRQCHPYCSYGVNTNSRTGNVLVYCNHLASVLCYLSSQLQSVLCEERYMRFTIYFNRTCLPWFTTGYWRMHLALHWLCKIKFFLYYFKVLTSLFLCNRWISLVFISAHPYGIAWSMSW